MSAAPPVPAPGPVPTPAAIPTQFLNELWDLLKALWATPNRWLRRLIIAAMVAPFVSMIMGMIWGPLAMVSTLIPLLVLVGWATLRVDPLILGIVNQYPFGKKVTGWVILIAGLELAWAFFCGIFPLGNDLRVSFTALFALVAAAAVAGGASYLGLTSKWPYSLAKILVLAAALCGLLLLLGGRKNAEKNLGEARKSVAEAASAVATPVSKAVNGAVSSGVCPGARDISINFASSGVDIPIDPVCWTGWIQIPPGADFSARNGDLGMEFLFINGHRWNVGGPPKNIGQVPASTFRIRGEGGKVTIYLSPTLKR